MACDGFDLYSLPACVDILVADKLANLVAASHMQGSQLWVTHRV